jgi:hypothetical protein
MKSISIMRERREPNEGENCLGSARPDGPDQLSRESLARNDLALEFVLEGVAHVALRTHAEVSHTQFSEKAPRQTLVL